MVCVLPSEMELLESKLRLSAAAWVLLTVAYAKLTKDKQGGEGVICSLARLRKMLMTTGHYEGYGGDNSI